MPSKNNTEHVAAWRRRTKEKAILYKGSACLV